MSTRSLKIKVCGMKDPDNIRQLLRLQPDFLGLIFHPGSPRYVGLEPGDLLELIATLEIAGPSRAKAAPVLTGVFVDADPGRIRELTARFALGAIQLHGQETPELCRASASGDTKIIKAFGISADFDWEKLDAYSGAADYFLFDTKTAHSTGGTGQSTGGAGQSTGGTGQSTGGTGQRFDWNLLKNYILDTPYFLSGGIGIEEIPQILEMMTDDRMAGVDLNSKFESSPGIKDIMRLEDTFKQLRNE